MKLADDKKKRGPPLLRGKGRAAAVIVSANVLLATLLWLGWRQRHGGVGGEHPELAWLTAGDPAAQRAKLLQRIQAWNARAAASGDASLLPIRVSEAQRGPVGEAPTVAPSVHAADATCDPTDPDPAFRMRPADDVAREYPEIAAKLQQHAKNNEIMLALANGVMICKNTTICWWDGGNILEAFLTILEHNSVTNYVIGVMDDETEVYLKARAKPTNWFRVHIHIPEAQQKSHPANQVSTIKYSLIQTFLQLGYHTLITDMDLVYLANPFDHLHRDADIEIQTDGFDSVAYGLMDGIRDPTMGWGGGGLFMKTFTTNVGCMWVKANARSFKLMVQVANHLASQPGWDQQVFNEYLLRPSHGGSQSAYAHLRVMDIDYWLNSKIFFRSRRSRYLPGASSTAPRPILVHFNYHPDKYKRQQCIMERYFNGKLDACDQFPGGSEPGT